MIRLRVTHGFRDLEAGIHRKPGEVFEASEARARVVLAAGVAEAVNATDEEAPAAAQGSEAAKPERRGKSKRVV